MIGPFGYAAIAAALGWLAWGLGWWLLLPALFLLALPLLLRWLARHACRIRRYVPAPRPAVTAAVTVIRPLPRRVIRGQVEPPRRVH